MNGKIYTPGVFGGTMDKLILVIEDDKEISKVVKSYLTVQGYRVNTTFDGEEGIREFRSKHL